MGNIKDNYFFILLSILPISILIGPAVSLINILIFDISFVILIILKKEFKWINNFYIKLIFLIYIYLIFNTFISIDYNLSIFRNLGFLRFIILFIGINYFFNNDKFKKIFIIWSFIIFLVAFDVFIEKIFGQNIFGFSAENSKGSQRIVSFFKDEAIPGSFIYGFSFILIGFYLTKIKNLNINSQLLIILFISILFTSIVVTGERSNSLKFLISLVLFFVMFKELSIFKRFFLLSSVLVIIISVISSNDYLKGRAYGTSIYILNTYVNSFQNPNPGPEGNPYAELSRSGFEVFKKYPYFGAGNKNYRVETCKKNINKNYYCETHPHQIYFEILSEHGLIGGIILLGILFTIFFKSLNIIINSKEYISLGCLVYLMALFSPLLPSGSFFSDYNSTIFFINLSIMFGISKKINIFKNSNSN